MTTARMPRGRRAAPVILPFPTEPPVPVDRFIFYLTDRDTGYRYGVTISRHDSADTRRCDGLGGLLHTSEDGRSCYLIDYERTSPAPRLVHRRRG